MGDIVEFPRVIKIATLWSEGQFGLTVDNISTVSLKDNEIMIWFGDDTEERPWDLSLVYPNNTVAENSYNEFQKAFRRMKVKVVTEDDE